jgi:single-stranded-DNA-specific exonuclease
LEKIQLDAFRTRFAEAVRQHAGNDLIEPRIELAAWLMPEQIRERLMDELAGLHPFGQGNPEPVFGLRGVVFTQRPEVFKEQHFRFSFDDGHGRRLFGVAWKMADRLPPVGTPIDLAVELTWNYFNDRKLLQLELIDWRRTTD